jgi:hypothetical protein
MSTVIKEIGKKIREDIGNKMGEKMGMKAMKLRGDGCFSIGEQK